MVVRMLEVQWPKRVFGTITGLPVAAKKRQTKKILEWGHEGKNDSSQLTRGRCMGYGDQKNENKKTELGCKAKENT